MENQPFEDVSPFKTAEVFQLSIAMLGFRCWLFDGRPVDQGDRLNSHHQDDMNQLICDSLHPGSWGYRSRLYIDVQMFSDFPTK